MITRLALVSALLALASGCSSSDPASTGDAGADSASDSSETAPSDADAASTDGFPAGDCGAACGIALGCGYKMPFGCGDWCEGNKAVVPCIAKAKSCDEVCTCRDGVGCALGDAGGD